MDTVKPEENKGKGFFKNIGRTIGLIWRYDKKYLIVKLTVSIITSVLPVISAWYSALFINKIVSREFGSIFDPGLFKIVIFYIALLVLQALFQILYRYFDDRFFISFSQYFEILSIEKRSQIDIQKYEDPKFNDLVQKVNENFHRFIRFTDLLFYVFENIIQITVALVVIARYNPYIALVIFIFLLPDLFIEMKYGESIYGIWGAKSEIKRKYFEDRRHFMNVNSLTEVKIFKLKEFFSTRINDLLSNFNNEIIKTENRKRGLKFVATFVSFTVTGVIVFLLIKNVVAGVLLIGTFTFLLSQINNLRGSITNFFFNVSKIYGDNMFVRDVFAFFDTVPVVEDGTQVLPIETPDITFDNVSFGYPGTEKNILNNISLTIKAGEKIAIVGVNGAGKTTFTKLVTRFYDPTQGSILLNESIPLKQVQLKSWYEKVGLLAQEFAKYKLPIKDAIALGDTSKPFDLEQVKYAATQSGANEFIEEWKEGYDTQLGKEFEGGIEPSVGQWQKIALARMFYKNPQILILDEPTASIDAVAEMGIFNKLENLPKDKTVILISHRFNTVKNANKIIVIEHGSIAEMGNHEELMKKEGIYHNLFTTQKDSYSN
ncbi:ABC transporter ATP-binding protein [Candidatus Nomurabacteria bacterium]|nr:ABC transporter ATP-binding protein [Candidatus Nomurabacteria bacterium]